MTRKDYKKLAEAINQSYKEGAIQECAISRIGDVMYEDNPRFDWARFKDACGLEG